MVRVSVLQQGVKQILGACPLELGGILHLKCTKVPFLGLALIELSSRRFVSLLHFRSCMASFCWWTP